MRDKEPWGLEPLLEPDKFRRGWPPIYGGQSLFTVRCPSVFNPEEDILYAAEGIICAKAGLLYMDKSFSFAEDNRLVADRSPRYRRVSMSRKDIFRNMHIFAC